MLKSYWRIFDFFYAQRAVPNYHNWSNAQVLDWLKQVGLEDLVLVFRAEKIDGICMRELALLTKDFYSLKNYLKEDFQITSQHSILKLFASLKTLV